VIRLLQNCYYNTPLVHWTYAIGCHIRRIDMKVLARYQIILLGEQRHINADYTGDSVNVILEATKCSDQFTDSFLLSTANRITVNQDKQIKACFMFQFIEDTHRKL